jgi:glutamine synthetase
MFAPTKAVWSTDNRTAGFRICGTGTKAVRVECRIGGADLNPYLALAALLAAGLEGVQNKLALEPEASGDLYSAGKVRDIPKTIDQAVEELDASTMLRRVMGDDVIDHYVNCGAWEIRERDRVVTDWEVARGFERA